MYSAFDVVQFACRYDCFFFSLVYLLLLCVRMCEFESLSSAVLCIINSGKAFCDTALGATNVVMVLQHSNHFLPFFCGTYGMKIGRVFF